MMNSSSSSKASPTAAHHKKQRQHELQQFANSDNWLQQQQHHQQQMPQKRQDVLELRQRIQNILLTDNQPVASGGGRDSQQHYQTHALQPTRLTPQPPQLDDGSSGTRFSLMRPPSNNLYQTAPSTKPPEQLHRLLSEERNEGGISNRSKQFQGFQENLLMNRRGVVNGTNPQNMAYPMGGNNQTLNKGMLSSQNQGVTTSESSKIMQKARGIDVGMIKSKRVLEIVQQRHKGCSFCVGAISPVNSRLHPHSTILMLSHDAMRLLVRETLDKKYLTSQDYYNSKIVSDIMYNENRHIVSVFKDYLIFDDFSEYLKRYYRDHEAFDRLPKVFEFYEKYSKVFPNYVALPAESKYMFKNIERKQKLIDERHQQIIERQERQKQEQEEARALGVALDSSVVHRMRMSKNLIFGSQFMNDLTDINAYQHPNEIDEGGMLRQQSSKKIIDMLTVIQASALESYKPNSVMNQILNQQQQISSSRQQSIQLQTNQSVNTNGNLEALINQLHQFDAKGDSSILHTRKTMQAVDISLSSSHGMSSFLQDFDLNSNPNKQYFNGGGHPSLHKLIGLDDDEEDVDHLSDDEGEFQLVVEQTPMKHNLMGQVQQESKRASTKNLGATASRQSLQSNMRVTPSSQGSTNNMMIVATGKNTVQKSVHSKKGSIKNTNQQVMQMVVNKGQQQQQQTQQQWSNMLLSSSGGNAKKPESVRKVGLMGSGKSTNNYATQPQQVSTPLQASSKVTKQPTPKGGRAAAVKITQQVMSISPQALQQQQTMPSRGGQRQSMHSAETQIVTQQSQPVVSMQQHSSQLSFKSNTNAPQQLVVIHHPNNGGGRTSQVSLGSPLSQHSIGGGVTKIGKNAVITKEMLQSMPAGSSLKQIATAAAKANLGQARASITDNNNNSAAKKSGNSQRQGNGNQAPAATKPHLQIPLQTHNHQHLLPRSGQTIKTESFAGVNQSTPSSLNGGLNIPAHQLGSAGNSQSSMRISPDFSLVPNHGNVLLLSGGTPGSVNSLKKATDPVSRSFKAQPQNTTPQNISNKLNPNAISQSIRDAVSKLLPPQPKVIPGVSSSLQFTSGMNPLKSSMKNQEASVSPASATAPPQSLMNNTAALFNKLFTGNTPNTHQTPTSNLRSSQQKPDMPTIQQFNPHQYPPNTIHLEQEDNHAQQLSAVYSTRVPQKKNFSSPDDLQLRIAARKNQHQQLAIATAQNTLQPLRKSANDFYEGQSVSPKKVLVVLKAQGGGGNNRNGSPQSVQNAQRYKKVNRIGSAEKDEQIYQQQLNHQALYGHDANNADDLEEAALEEEEYLDELDERNDIYTAKGQQQQQQLRQMASSATATTNTNTYNFKVNPHHQNSAQHKASNADGKRHPSMNSDKSGKSVQSGAQVTHPYQRVLTSFSTNTATGLNSISKKKVKVTPQQLEPTSHHGTLGAKLYDKIRTGINPNHAGTPQQVQSLKHNNLQSNYNSNPNPVAAKKKPSTIFTFNNK
ncbi:hypothetical protein FGO68_gene17483 [Halteria grandinella]|uniref:Uncharacterized protein n=1 Tax=Halteria grandinella TaxID=5974 RepID=A0A8J8T8U1_HALGN|nr:hypothetical protein FGO68_gene17483 [Halteria grandinella]